MPPQRQLLPSYDAINAAPPSAFDIACSEKLSPTAPGNLACLWQYTPEAIATSRENSTTLFAGLNKVKKQKTGLEKVTGIKVPGKGRA